jgi:methyltransferase (TIGR00027 family)
MTDKGVEQKPSETAFFAALRRSIANIEFHNAPHGPDDLAGLFLPPHYRFLLKFKPIRENTKNKLDEALPGLTEYMIARTAYFDHLFLEALQDHSPQIVILGAGYDTRAYRFADSNHSTRIFELDVPSTQARKLEYLRKGHIAVSKQVIYVPIDFNRESLGDALVKAGYTNDQKTLFIWEGVTYYLEHKAVDATLKFVSHTAHPESTLAFDYTISLTDENRHAYYGATEFAETMRARHGGEALLFSIAEGQIETFLAQRGLAIVTHLDNTEIETKFLTSDGGTLIGHLTGHFRFVTVSPQTNE